MVFVRPSRRSTFGSQPSRVRARVMSGRRTFGSSSGSGSQTRSFCYVTDLVDGILRLMESDVHDPVNIGNPHEMTIEEIARAIIDISGSKSQIVYRPLPEDDPKVRKPDITRARTLLGWEPKVPLREGLESTIRYFREALAVQPRSENQTVPEEVR